MLSVIVITFAVVTISNFSFTLAITLLVCVCSLTIPLAVVKNETSGMSSSYQEIEKRIEKKRNKLSVSSKNTITELKRQNFNLMKALLSVQEAQAKERKQFDEILSGIDKALSSLPIRLEKIRVKNQKKLDVINSTKPQPDKDTATEYSIDSSSEDSPVGASGESNYYPSSTMKRLLRKIDQLNEVIETIQQGDASPIEFLVNTELHAMSLLKKEIKTAKRKIESSKTDTETVLSYEESIRDSTTEDFSKENNPFSNELDKASNFKIFENHMILQEKALNLLTRKIRETEEALQKEIEAKETLKRENEALAKEIFRLKSAEKESNAEKILKSEKFKAELEAAGNRPYRLIKELKTKLEEKEKSFAAWKSKYFRLEATNSNKMILLENEKKKNFELGELVQNMKKEMKSLTSHISSLQLQNKQLKNQNEILKQQAETLAKEILKNLKCESEDKRQVDVKAKLSRIPEIYSFGDMSDEKLGTKALELDQTMNESESKDEKYYKTLKELLNTINNVKMACDSKSSRSFSHDRIQEILHMSESEMKLLLGDYQKKSIEKEVEILHEKCRSIINEGPEELSAVLSSWLFDVLLNKLLQLSKGDSRCN